VRLVLAAAVTKLLELQTAGGRLLVLRRRVVPLLALGALQCHNFTHFSIPSRNQFSVAGSQLSVLIVPASAKLALTSNASTDN
jgi:hypothetical protein